MGCVGSLVALSCVFGYADNVAHEILADMGISIFLLGMARNYLVVMQDAFLLVAPCCD